MQCWCAVERWVLIREWGRMRGREVRVVLGGTISAASSIQQHPAAAHRTSSPELPSPSGPDSQFMIYDSWLMKLTSCIRASDCQLHAVYYWWSWMISGISVRHSEGAKAQRILGGRGRHHNQLCLRETQLPCWITISTCGQPLVIDTEAPGRLHVLTSGTSCLRVEAGGPSVTILFLIHHQFLPDRGLPFTQGE